MFQGLHQLTNLMNLIFLELTNNSKELVVFPYELPKFHDETDHIFFLDAQHYSDRSVLSLYL
ncbi:unnamed protein product [Schistosoma mattheei]|uniref:Uncharacterized protein n=1 Tax=Schistosoma mattheei TaxID=31246 RepID=A0A3P8GVQ3_9TREM|nr:unnamed protein product [Schistosoma mattheei]